jgi:hypothetical protein
MARKSRSRSRRRSLSRRKRGGNVAAAINTALVPFSLVALNNNNRLIPKTGLKIGGKRRKSKRKRRKSRRKSKKKSRRRRRR